MAASATAAVDINSAYVWRGITFNDGMVIQPSIDVAADNGLGINVWGNYDIGDYDGAVDENAFSEIDLTVSYGFTVGDVDISAGAIHYAFPAVGDSNNDGVGENFMATTELYLSVGMPIVGGLSAAADAYYDIDAIDAFSYATLGLSYAYDMTDKLNLEAGGSIAYAGDDFVEFNGTGEDGGLYSYTLSLTLGYTITDAWSVAANLTYVDALDDDNLKEEPDGPLDTQTIYGVSVAYAF
jgi:outer membrane scaffolding protein for murein synthesis (MipA/OmpV family)